MKTSLWRTLLTGTALAATAGTAHAQSTPTPATGTPAGTTISNRAQASFTVNGTPASVQSNLSTFKIDRKVDLTVVAQTGTTKVNLSQTGAVETFIVTNKTNGVQDFLLDPDQLNLSLGVLPGTDNFDVSNMRVFVDRNDNGTYEPGTDDQTFIDELAADASVAVFLVADIPNNAAAALAFTSLRVNVAAGETPGARGTLLVPTDLNLLNQDDEVDIIFADNDSDGLALGDIARNGQARAYAAFEVGARTVDLSILKSSRIVEDGVSTLNPKALPGAVVEYCLLVRNATALVPATGVVLTDVVPTNTSYVPGSIRVGGATCLLGGEAQDDDADDANDNRLFGGSYDGGSRTVAATIPAVIGGGQVAAVFRVTIN